MTCGAGTAGATCGAGAPAPALPPEVAQVHAGPDVYRVSVPFKNISTNDTNCYVVLDGGEALVVDTGAPTDEGAAVLSRALDALGVDRARARWFLTHCHLDHAGLVDRVVPSGARLIVGERDYRASLDSRGPEGFERMSRRFAAEGLSFSDASAYARIGAESPLFSADRLDVRFAADGEEVPCGSVRFRVVTTPGHTPGHQALFDPASGILFGGDHVLFVISPSIALFPDGADGAQAYLDSLAKVRALHPTQLFHSHGDIRPDFLERIDWLAAHHRERLDEMCRIVRARPGLSGYEALRRIKWNVPFASWEGISFLQRWCIIVEGIVYLDHLVAAGRVEREADAAGVLRYRSA